MAITAVLTLSVVSAPQQADAIFMVENLELSVGDNMLVSENDFIVFEVNEEKEKTDLNDDEDFEDTVLHVYDITTGILTNLGLSGNIKMYDERNSMLDGNLLAFVVSEHAQGNTDLNGDGNAFYGRGAGDISLHVYDHSTGVITNLQQGGDISAVNGNLVVFTVSEYHQGEDLNGDGLFDTSVLHVYDHSKGTTTNVGLESNVLAFDGNLVAFAVNERDQGNTDLNGDGDTGNVDSDDWILHVYDVSADATTNVGLAFEPDNDLILDGNLVAFTVSERRQGNTDLNGDGDKSDRVLHVYDHATGTTVNLELSGNASASDGNLVAFAVNERGQGKMDLNGDGIVEGRILHTYDHVTGIVRNLELIPNSIAGDNLITFTVSEHNQDLDLNGDGDTKDFNVIHIYDHSTSAVTNLGLSVDDGTTIGTGILYDNLIAFTVDEFGQGSTDLNGDGDTEEFDDIVHIYDHSTGITTNLELQGSIVAIKKNLIIFTVNEFAQGNVDLNNDGDTGNTNNEDNILHVYDHSMGLVSNLKIDADDSLSFFDNNQFAFADNNKIVFLVSESKQETDLNGDGDTDDRIIHLAELSEDKVIEDELFCGKDVSEFDSVIEGTDGDDILQGTKGNDLIFGMNGDDLIYSSNGNDCIYGGNGNDSIFGRDGNDTIFGGNGNDRLFGAMGNDILRGDGGNDLIIDDAGNDLLDGGENNDLCYDKYGNNEFEECESRNE